MAAHHSTAACRRLLIAAGCLVVQVIALVHLTVVRHVVCSVHGDVAHADVVGAAATEDVASQPRNEPALQRRDAAAERDHDDHCGWWTERRDPRADDPVRTSAAWGSASQLAMPAAVRPVATGWLYRLAPKTSPPMLHAPMHAA